MNQSCIAVDIGGTKMLAAEVNGQGQILHVLRGATRDVSKREKIEDALGLVKEYEATFGWAGGDRPPAIGMGINGLIDPVCGKWLGYTPEEEALDVRQLVQDALGIPCYIDNDVKCTVMAENEFGNGGHSRDMIYINVGTGLAAGMIVSGRVVRGSDGFAGEVGFVQMDDPRQDIVGVGDRDSDMEMYASGMGIHYCVQKYAAQYPDSVLGRIQGRRVTGQDVYEAGRQGDALANLILDILSRSVAALITDMTCILSPEIVVLGGGLIRSHKLLERIYAKVSDKAKQHIDRGLVLTGLDTDYAGLMGAATIGLGYQEQY